MASRAKVPVFTDTNLDTRIAFDVSPEITARDFKRDLERAHLICFPKLGAIRVNGLMVKQRSCFYHLPDSLPMKHAFQGLRGTWFIHAEAHPWSDSNESGLSECVVAEIRDRTSNSIKVTDSLEPKIPVSSANKNHVNCKRKKNGIKRIPYAKVALQAILANAHRSKKKKRKRVTENCSLHCTVKGLEKGCLSRNGGDTAEERELSAILENHSETLSESLSVSGIIKKYFSDYEEVSLRSNFTSRANQSQRKKQLTTRTDSNCSTSKVSGISQFTPKTPPRVLPFPLSTDLSSKTSRNIVKRTGVGNRLVVASNNLGRSVKSATGLCRFGDRKLSVPKSSSFVRSIVFEISDSDE
ncbi:unnamed protein product [Camellia sinensis]